MQKATRHIFGDLDLNLSVNPNTKDITPVFDEIAIKRSLRNLILTKNWERPFHPEIGCSVQGLLFDNITPLTSISIVRSIEDAINNYEPRVNLVSVVANPDYNRNGYNISIAFYIVNAAPDIVNYNLFLKQWR